jgi:hypothetical protein
VRTCFAGASTFGKSLMGNGLIRDAASINKWSVFLGLTPNQTPADAPVHPYKGDSASESDEGAGRIDLAQIDNHNSAI